MIRAAAVLLLLSCSGCLQFQIWHIWAEDRVPAHRIEQLEPGTTDLQRSLELLGAPHLVWEYRGDGMALAWAWLDQLSPSFAISYNVARYAPSASFRLGHDNLEWVGIVLFFSDDLVLERAEQGNLRDLTAGMRTRPALVDEDQ